MDVIEVDSLSMGFSDTTVLDNVTFTVETGEAFGFLGPNGSGKSTTINVLLGLFAPTSGEASVLGYDVETERNEIHAQVGVLPEGVAPFPGVSGEQHVEFAARANGVSVDPTELLDYTGLDRATHSRPVDNYSTGMRQRLWLAMALVGDPELIILDEPMAGLDPNGVRELREIVGDLTDDGRTIFFSSHRLGEVQAVCDRVGVLYDGQIERVIETDEVSGDEVAGQPVVRFQAASIDDRLLSEVQARDDVGGLEYDGNWLRVECTDPVAKVEVIETILSRADVSNLVAERPSLEDLFTREIGGTGASE